MPTAAKTDEQRQVEARPRVCGLLEHDVQRLHVHHGLVLVDGVDLADDRAADARRIASACERRADSRHPVDGERHIDLRHRSARPAPRSMCRARRRRSGRRRPAAQNGGCFKPREPDDLAERRPVLQPRAHEAFVDERDRLRRCSTSLSVKQSPRAEADADALRVGRVDLMNHDRLGARAARPTTSTAVAMLPNGMQPGVQPDRCDARHGARRVAADR